MSRSLVLIYSVFEKGGSRAAYSEVGIPNARSKTDQPTTIGGESAGHHNIALLLNTQVQCLMFT
jgi:hypothetical protein